MTVPPGFESKEAFLKELREGVEERCEEIKLRMKEENKKFKGKENICLDPHFRPDNPYIKSDRDPKIACKDEELRKELIEGYVLFRKEHRDSQQRVASGEKEVTFPYGTYWWCRYGGMPSGPKPPELM